MTPAITVLADPVPIGWYIIKEPLKASARWVRDRIRPFPLYMRSSYRGHFAVTRSIVEGLEKLGVTVTYNPRRLSNVAETVLVPCGRDALRQAIDWKRAGSIRMLLAGPNLVDFPSERRDLMCAPEVDWLLVHGPWFRDNFISDCPELRGRVVPAPAGVDTEYWKPDGERRELRRVIFYEKHKLTGSPPALQPYIDFVKHHGYEVVHLRYGYYLQEEYRELLRDAAFLVGFSPEESQGIAWAEAWSMDVPTFLWNQPGVTYKGRSYATSSAPYLSDATGKFFTDFDSFQQALSRWLNGETHFAPREWLIEHMSDEACARRVCAIANIPVPGIATATNDNVTKTPLSEQVSYD